MTVIRFLKNAKGICGFKISGHSTADSEDEIGRIVCSAVSSAAYLTANTISEIVPEPCNITVNDAEMILQAEDPSPVTVTLLKGLQLHLTELSKQYPNHISIFSEV
ncbi:MAG: ribosomal-processing cysteine protease Prp [Clostridia bacterium]|nr:ribosomal-processing cysteine protease Prp [Clostridia bacterium]